MHLRPATPDDLPALAAIYRDAVLNLGPAAYSPEQVTAWAAWPSDAVAFARHLSDGLTLVAEIDHQPAAFAQLQPADKVSLLYCKINYARRGLATALLGALEAAALRAGQMFLRTDASRIARPLFTARGFRVVAREEVGRGGITFERFSMRKLLLAPEATRWALLGNSASGKSTLARELAAHTGAPVLDLDAIAWRRDRSDPVRRDPADTAADLNAFTSQHPAWILEGCYEDLIAHVLPHRPVLLFLDTPVATCLERARSRPHEAHKFPTPEAQQAALNALLAWIAAYPDRKGPLSAAAHHAVFAACPGPKHRLLPPAQPPPQPNP